MFKSINKALIYGKILTFLSLYMILLAVEIRADLAPKEEDDDDDVGKPEVINDMNLLNESTTQAPKGNLGFIHAFIASFSVIIVSEIGDKTFFIAAIMSMKYPRLCVFGGAISALAVMTVLSAVFGMVFIHFIPPSLTRWVSVGLFIVFGLKMLHEGWNMTATEAAEEMEDVQAEIRQREDERKLKRNEPRIAQMEIDTGQTSSRLLSNGNEGVAGINGQIRTLNRESTRVVQGDAETGGVKKAKVSAFMMLFRIFMQAFTMTFVAEWGDRSQITTIVLAARENLWGVIAGGIIGHGICTGLGVIGGRIIAQKISVRTVTLIGGVVFIIFAITSSIWDPTSTDTSSLGSN